MTVTMTPELKQLFLERIAQGESVRSICDDPAMPSYSSFTSHRIKDPAFSEGVDRARIDGAEAFAEDIIRIADTQKDPNKAKVMIDARKWLAAKLMPKKYGEQLHLTGDVKDDRDVESKLAVLFRKAGIDVAPNGAATPGGPEQAGRLLERQSGGAGLAGAVADAIPALSEADGVSRRRQGL